MRRIILNLAFVFASGVCATASAAAVSSAINAVTVYQDLAVVTRSAQVELAAGQHELVFENLPGALRENSLQVSVRGTNQASVLDVGMRKAFLASVHNQKLKQAEDAVQALRQRLAELDDQVVVLDNQRELVLMMQRSLTEPTKDGQRPSFQDLKSMQELSADSLKGILGELRAITKQKEQLEVQEYAAQAELRQLQGERDLETKAVSVRVELPTAGKLTVDLSYAVPGASWAPTYDARLRHAERAVELSYFGLIRQSTGEDWKDVAVTLSTARPSLGGSAPTLSPWILDVETPFLAHADMAESVTGKIAMVPAPVMAERAPREAPARPARYVTAQVQGEATSASFRIVAPTTVLSDNASQRVAITNVRLPATLNYQTTPALMETAFLNTETVNTTEYPFLAGSLNVFLENDFIAADKIKTVMPNENLQLSLGADEGISIKRALLNRFTENTGFSGSGRRVTYTYGLTVKNNKSTTETIVVKDRLPVSRHEKIVVKLLTPSNDDIKRDAEGGFTWRWELAPGATREATLKFSIDYPGDMAVTGLN